LLITGPERNNNNLRGIMSFPKYMLILFLALTSCIRMQREIVLLDDNYQSMQRGPLVTDYGARTEYHFFPEAAPKGNWAVSTFRYNLPPSWYIRETDGQRVMYQKGVNPDLHWHPMVIAGNELWKDYTIRISFLPLHKEYRCGIVFRYQNDRCYYLLGVKNDTAFISLIKDATGFREPYEKTIARDKIEYDTSKFIDAEIKLNGNRIKAYIKGGPVFSVIDSTFHTGKTGYLADGPAMFGPVKIFTDKKEKQRLDTAISTKEKKEIGLQHQNPKPVIWKKISTPGYGTGRNLRFGDLNGDGVTDVLIGQVMHHGPKDRNSELSCLTAMTFDGEILWQTGKPDPWKDYLTNDVAFQIHDIDNDGKNEVVFCRNMEIVIAEAGTGKTKIKRNTPETPGGRPTASGNNIFDRILGDCLYFCDLKGKGYDGDFILKDRYRYLWAFDNQLNMLWKSECNTGHYPFAMDIDNDMKDEIMMGYTLFDDNGIKIWSLDDTLNDHADGVALVRFGFDQEIRLMCAASDEGMLFADMKGNILKHHYIGHVQNPAVANFRDDLPGLETVSVNFWGNQGIIHLFDSEGEIYHEFEPNQYGSMCLPVNWTGKSEEFFVLNANVDEGGAYDGWGRKVLGFPDDGHPDMCYAVLDITGDCRDEIIVWDPSEIWVYTQDDSPLGGDLYKPERNPLYNYSNYQATVSLPGWKQ
jgi:rhamnogalacturonan endolyase